MILTWQSIITAGAILSAVLAISAAIARLVRWVDQQKKQDIELQSIKKNNPCSLSESLLVSRA